MATKRISPTIRPGGSTRDIVCSLSPHKSNSMSLHLFASNSKPEFSLWPDKCVLRRSIPELKTEKGMEQVLPGRDMVSRMQDGYHGTSTLHSSPKFPTAAWMWQVKGDKSALKFEVKPSSKIQMLVKELNRFDLTALLCMHAFNGFLHSGGPSHYEYFKLYNFAHIFLLFWHNETWA